MHKFTAEQFEAYLVALNERDLLGQQISVGIKKKWYTKINDEGVEVSIHIDQQLYEVYSNLA